MLSCGFGSLGGELTCSRLPGPAWPGCGRSGAARPVAGIVPACSSGSCRVTEQQPVSLPLFIIYLFFSFLCEGEKRADSPSRDMKTQICLPVLLLSNESHLRTQDHTGVLRWQEERPYLPERITYSTFSADQEKCLLSGSGVFLPLFYFTYSITQAQMVFVRSNWQALEAVFRAARMEKSQSCCPCWKKTLHLIFFFFFFFYDFCRRAACLHSLAL